MPYPAWVPGFLWYVCAAFGSFPGSYGGAFADSGKISLANLQKNSYNSSNIVHEVTV
jgi:hypothetical protein